MITNLTTLMLRVYNTLTRRKEDFVPLKDRKVGMYTCGPTVYDIPHLGNFRSFVMSDNVRRYLEYLGYEVTQVLNITDIDDKTIKASAEEGASLHEYTRRYEEVFHDGLRKLNVLPAHHYPRATEHFEEMVRIVEGLEERGLAYERDGSVYFPVEKVPDYGKLSGVNLDGMKTGARVDVDEYDKENPRDFALMKASTPEEIERGIFIDTKWGRVRPGWHIECSALSMKYLGPTIDIHTGGVDLIFPHHENEVAQSESYTGKEFVKYWIHGEHLMANGEKMSKSLGNYMDLDRAIEEYSANVVRFMFVSTHYRKVLDYTKGFAENARSNYERLRNAYENLLFAVGTASGDPGPEDHAVLAKIPDLERKFKEAMDDDFNNPAAVAVFHELARLINGYLLVARKDLVLQSLLGLFRTFSMVLGLSFPEPAALSPEQAEMVLERERARRERNWEEADRIRSRLAGEGILLEDTEWGTKWSPHES